MSVTDFYADSWQEQSPIFAKGFSTRNIALGQLGQGFRSLTGSNQIYGQGADSMKAYILEVHLPLIQSLSTALETFQTAIGVYWSGYQGIDSDGNFKLVKEDLTAHQNQLDSGMSDMDNFAQQLQNIANHASNQGVWLGSGGANQLLQVKDQFENMHRIARDLSENWENYEKSDHGFNQVEEMISTVKGMLNKIGQLTVGSGRTYRAGSFNLSLQTLGSLVKGLQSYNNTNSQKAQAAWDSMYQGYVDDQKAITKKEQEEANRHKGFWEIVGGVVAVGLAAVAIVATAGLATPLVVVAGVAALGSASYGLSNIYEGSNMVVTGADHAWNPLRDTVFGGNQTAYDIFGQTSMAVAGTMIPVGSAVSAFEAGGGLTGTLSGAIATGTARSVFTMTAGYAANGIGTLVTYNTARFFGADQITASDWSNALGMTAAVVAGGKAYRASNPQPVEGFSGRTFENGMGSEKTLNAFLKANPDCNISDYNNLVKEQSPWPKGFTPEDGILKQGDTFEMALSKNQPSTSPGGFATDMNSIEDVNYVRNNLAVKSNWKPDVTKVVQYKVKEGMQLPVQKGPVGPQIDLNEDKYLPGGAQQFKLIPENGRSLMDYLQIIGQRNIR